MAGSILKNINRSLSLIVASAVYTSVYILHMLHKQYSIIFKIITIISLIIVIKKKFGISFIKSALISILAMMLIFVSIYPILSVLLTLNIMGNEYDSMDVIIYELIQPYSLFSFLLILITLFIIGIIMSSHTDSSNRIANFLRPSTTAYFLVLLGIALIFISAIISTNNNYPYNIISKGIIYSHLGYHLIVLFLIMTLYFSLKVEIKLNEKLNSEHALRDALLFTMGINYILFNGFKYLIMLLYLFPGLYIESTSLFRKDLGLTLEDYINIYFEYPIGIIIVNNIVIYILTNFFFKNLPGDHISVYREKYIIVSSILLFVVSIVVNLYWNIYTYSLVLLVSCLYILVIILSIRNGNEIMQKNMVSYIIIYFLPVSSLVALSQYAFKKYNVFLSDIEDFSLMFIFTFTLGIVLYLFTKYVSKRLVEVGNGAHSLLVSYLKGKEIYDFKKRGITLIKTLVTILFIFMLLVIISYIERSSINYSLFIFNLELFAMRESNIIDKIIQGKLGLYIFDELSKWRMEFDKYLNIGSPYSLPYLANYYLIMLIQIFVGYLTIYLVLYIIILIDYRLLKYFSKKK